MNSEFENRLRLQPLRKIPTAWRAEILRAAEAPHPEPSMFFARFLTGWLWPHPKAWATLGVAWTAVLILHVTAPDEPMPARASSSQTPQTFAKFQQEQIALAQLLGSAENNAPPDALPVPPKPRSERPLRELIG